MSDKQDTISIIYFDRSGFSSKTITLQYARQKQDNKDDWYWLLFHKNVEQKTAVKL